MTDLESLEWKLDELIARIAQTTTASWSEYSPRQQLADLRELDQYFRAIDRHWSAVVGEAGARVAAELLDNVDVEARWRTFWHPVGEDAWTARKLIATDTATDLVQFGATDTGARAETSPLESPLYLQLILDLKYAASQPIAAIAAMFGLSQTAIQGRVSTFEARVVDTIAGRLLAPQLAADWTLMTLPDERPDYPRLLLLRVGKDPTAPEITLQIILEWPRERRRAGRPRGARRYARLGTRDRGPRLWGILRVPDPAGPAEGPELIFVLARGEYARFAPEGRREGFDRQQLLAIGTLSLEEAVRQALV
ncbi:MAG TPA: hypothetical protein VIL85_03250 [Thermomicrobiales bacterium]